MVHRLSRSIVSSVCLAAHAFVAVPASELHAQSPQAAQALQAPATTFLLRSQQVFDATSEQAHPGWVVLVTGSRITAVGPASAVTAPPDARTIDLPGMTLLPGLIEAHTHIFLHAYNETLWNDQVLKEPEAY